MQSSAWGSADLQDPGQLDVFQNQHHCLFVLSISAMDHTASLAEREQLVRVSLLSQRHK